MYTEFNSPNKMNTEILKSIVYLVENMQNM